MIFLRRLARSGGLLTVLLALTAPATLAAQDARPLTIDDYALWRTIEDAAISGDGRYVAYTLRHTNVPDEDEEPVLHIRDLETDREIRIPGAHDGEFSRDSRWIVYEVDEVKPDERRGGDEADADTAAADTTVADSAAPAPTPQRFELRELATGQTRSWERVRSATFNTTSTHLLLSRRPESGDRGDDDEARGTDHILHDLGNGRSHFLGAVGDAAFNRQGDLLAYAVESGVRDGNGLFVLHLPTDRVHVLENDTLIYSRVEWSDDGDRVAALKGHPVEDMRERDNALVAFADVRARLAGRASAAPSTLATSAARFPEGFVLSERAPLAWSEDGRRVFFGIIPQTPAPDTSKEPSTDSVANVDVWRTEDERVQSVQMVQAERDRNRTFMQAFDIAEERFIPLADSTMREVQLAPDGRWAVGMDPRPYVADTAHARADLYRVDTRTGDRTLVMRGQLVGQHEFGISPDSRRFLYWDDNRYHAYDLESGTSRALPGGENGEFVDREWDYVGPRPAYGVEGFARDGSGVVVRERYDLVLLPFGGGEPRNLTGGEGARREIVFRHVPTDPIDPHASRAERTGRQIDLTRPLTLSAYGQWTKKDGFYRLADGRLRELVYDDARFSRPERAHSADRLLFTRETFREFPDLRVADLDFDDMRRISDANPQQSEFLWGRSMLFDYEDPSGQRLQGVLMIPDDYREGERRPMLVTFYEKNSQNLHRYLSPSYLSSMGRLTPEALSRGYLMMLADVHFETGSSHSDMLEGVEAATRKVIDMGYADPERIGVHGHSYGGEGAAFIGTRSDMFAAVGMGAGVTDIEADFNQSWGWSYQLNEGSGAPGSDYYLFGQGRWGTTPFDDPDLYRFESAITHVREAEAPFLIMHGAADPIVDFSEGMNFYQALRYNDKEAYLLAYPGEGHGLRGLANRRDLTVRYFDFFDHFLRGEPAPEWMTEGVPYLVKVRRTRQ